MTREIKDSGQHSVKEDDNDRESSIIDKMASIFLDNNFKVNTNVFVKQSSTDLFAISPSGTASIYEVKLWDLTPANINRAARISELNTAGSGVSNSFVVMPISDETAKKMGVISINDLEEIINERLLKEVNET